MKKILMVVVLLIVSSAAFSQKGAYYSDRQFGITGSLTKSDFTVDEPTKADADIVITDKRVELIVGLTKFGFRIDSVKQLSPRRKLYLLIEDNGDNWVMGIINNKKDPHPYTIMLTHFDKGGEETGGVIFDIKEYEKSK